MFSFFTKKTRSISTTRTYKKVVRELQRCYGLQNVPSICFNGPNGSLHSLILPPQGFMIYLVSNKRGQIERFDVTNVLMNTNKLTGSIRLVIKTPIEGLWLFFQMGGSVEQTAYLVQEDFVNDFKKNYSYSPHAEYITEAVHEFLMK